MLVLEYNWVGLLNEFANTLRSLGEIEHGASGECCGEDV